MMIKTKKIVDEAAAAKFINRDKPAPVAKEKESTARNVTFKVDVELIRKMDKAAKALGITRSSFIKSAVSSVLANGMTFNIVKE